MTEMLPLFFMTICTHIYAFRSAMRTSAEFVLSGNDVKQQLSRPRVCRWSTKYFVLSFPFFVWFLSRVIHSRWLHHRETCIQILRYYRKSINFFSNRSFLERTDTLQDSSFGEAWNDSARACHSSDVLTPRTQNSAFHIKIIQFELPWW
jgi:hypothetical protein